MYEVEEMNWIELCELVEEADQKSTGPGSMLPRLLYFLLESSLLSNCESYFDVVPLHRPYRRLEALKRRAFCVEEDLSQ